MAGTISSERAGSAICVPRITAPTPKESPDAILQNAAHHLMDRTNIWYDLTPNEKGDMVHGPECSQHDWVQVHFVDDPPFLDRYVCRSCGEKKEFGLIFKVSAKEQV